MIEFNTSDIRTMIVLMDEHEGKILTGENEAGERQIIKVTHDEVIVETYQLNNWIRVNTFYRDGSRDETFTK